MGLPTMPKNKMSLFSVLLLLIHAAALCWIEEISRNVLLLVQEATIIINNIIMSPELYQQLVCL